MGYIIVNKYNKSIRSEVAKKKLLLGYDLYFDGGLQPKTGFNNIVMYPYIEKTFSGDFNISNDSYNSDFSEIDDTVESDFKEVHYCIKVVQKYNSLLFFLIDTISSKILFMLKIDSSNYKIENNFLIIEDYIFDLESYTYDTCKYKLNIK